MKTLRLNKLTLTVLLIAGVIIITAQVADKQTTKRESSYTSVIEEPLKDVMAKDKAARTSIMKRQRALLAERYDTTTHITTEVTMSRGKPLPVGPTAKLKSVTW